MGRHRSALLLLAVTLGSSFWGYASDDAYITYCYTRQWMETGEFRFNADISYGITAPGYAMLLGALAGATASTALDIPGWGSLLSITCLLYLTGLLWRFTRRSASLSIRFLPLIAGVMLFTMPLVLGMWGSENMVAVALIASAAILLFEKKHPLAAGFLAFLAIMARMDAGLGALLLLACTGAATIGLAVERLLPAGAAQRSCAVLLAIASLGPFWGSAYERLSDKWQEPLDERFRIYRELGRSLNQTADPDDVVATMEIGIIGYFARRPVLDLRGLVSPAVVAATRKGRLAEYLLEQRPEYIVDNPMFYAEAAYKSALRGSALNMNYSLVREFDTPEYRKGPVRLWRLVDEARAGR